MSRIFRIFLLALVVALGGMAATGPAAAGALEDAKRAGQVGEQADGYLGLVKGSVPGNVRALVKDINMKRREKYREIAANRGIAINAFEAFMGEKLIGRAAKGHYIRPAGGGWTRK